jgi:hypothetical protein
MFRALIPAAALVLGLHGAAPAQAQGTAYAADGRPEFCLLIDIAGDRQASEYVVGSALDDLGYSRLSGVGRRVLNQSQRLMGWMFLLYSQDLLHWPGDSASYYDTQDTIRAIIREYDGNVPALERASIPRFNTAAAGCRSNVRG